MPSREGGPGGSAFPAIIPVREPKACAFAKRPVLVAHQTKRCQQLRLVELVFAEPAEGKVRERYDRSRMKLIELLPKLTELRVFDNTEEGDPQKGQTPVPKLLLHMNRGKIVNPYDIPLVPQWAKPILQAAIKFSEKT